ncbi:uncharacterized protein [Nerophis lumbriciformis]|uniref:uncharacterized protein n=1 Tax=Nerophis lumbriciformis TaxID=546530 RepID=UPI003BAB6811
MRGLIILHNGRTWNLEIFMSTSQAHQLAVLSRVNNLKLNQLKTQEVILDSRRRKTTIQPLYIDGGCVERVSSLRFLGVHLEEDLSWRTNTTAIVKRAQQRLYFLRVLRNLHLRQDLLVSFYRCSVESILTYCICVWFCSCTAAERKALQRVVNSPQKIIGCPLPSLEELYNSRCLKKAANILKDPSHPGNSHFDRLPSGRRFRTMRTRTNKLKNSFYIRAITALNTAGM